ncbi:hypothetical protein Tco_1138806 [Tanacetum coccineum]
MFKRCSAMDLGTPVISAGFQENISKLSLSRLQSSILPFSDKLSPIVTVCFGYSGWIATLIPSAATGSLGGRAFCVSTTILHSAGIMVLLRIVTIPPSIENFSIPVLVECSPSPIVTVSDICPNGQDISPLNPRMWEFVEPDSGGADECGVEHVTPARDVASNELPNVFFPLAGVFHRPAGTSFSTRVPVSCLVNTMALNGLLRRVGLSLSCFSLENALAVREERVPLDAVTGLCLLLLGFLFLSLILTLRVGCASFDGSFRHKLGVFVRPEVFLGELFLP